MLFFLCALLLISTVDSILVVTPSGPVRGTVSTGVTSKEVDVFYGIPYAESPTDKLRFAPPVEAKPWTEELNASNSKSLPCYALSNDFLPRAHYSDDCLKIHIWVPKPTPKNATVMVYIHGGGFLNGDPLELLFQGSTLAGEENVIVASMNYRLNTFGFLNFGRQDAPGNVGLLDQQMALKWIRKNIASFGGNPNDVTIFGMSAGGASVGFHLLSPGSRGLFQRAILMSGVPNAPWSIKHSGEVIFNSKTLANFVGCSNDDMDKTMLCLQNMHPENFLVWAFGNYSTENMAPIGPTVDGSFISDLPLNLLGNGSVNDVDIMIGTTRNEGIYFALYDNPFLMGRLPEVTLNREEFGAILNSSFRRHPPSFIANLTSIFMKTEVDDPLVLRDLLDQILSDFFFVCPSQLFADLFSEKNKRVYRYVADHHFSKFLMFDIPEWLGMPHGIDTLLHMGVAASGPPAYTEEEARLSKRVMKWWANFARTGNPNNGNDETQWPVSTKEKREFLRISTNPAVENNFRLETCSQLNALKGYLLK